MSPLPREMARASQIRRLRSRSFSGHLVRLTRPGGQVFTYTYDIMDRMREKTTPDDFVLYTYDALAGHGQLVAVSNSQAVVHFDYDNSARLTGERLEISTGGVGAPGPVNYALDAAGNVLSETISPHLSSSVEKWSGNSVEKWSTLLGGKRGSE